MKKIFVGIFTLGLFVTSYAQNSGLTKKVGETEQETKTVLKKESNTVSKKVDGANDKGLKLKEDSKTVGAEIKKESNTISKKIEGKAEDVKENIKAGANAVAEKGGEVAEAIEEKIQAPKERGEMNAERAEKSAAEAKKTASNAADKIASIETNISDKQNKVNEAKAKVEADLADKKITMMWKSKRFRNILKPTIKKKSRWMICQPWLE